MKYAKYYLLAIAVILLDQAVKMLVYFNMELGEFGEIPVFGDWFKLHYTLNEGMAFGIKFWGDYGKLALSLFRWVAMGLITWYIIMLERGTEAHRGFIWCMALILGGAAGNVFDSTFYGVLLNNAPYMEQQPLFYPWFYGQVIDMFYFDIWHGRISTWVPIMGGQYYSLWPIFNIADSSIFVGVTLILLRQKAFFPQPSKEDTKPEPAKPVDDAQAEPVGDKQGE